MENPGTNPENDTQGGASSCGCCHSDTDEASQPEGAGENVTVVDADADTADTADTDEVSAGEAADADSDQPQEGEGDLASQLAERTEDLQRLSAEYANFRRRTERDRVNVIATAKASVVTDFLPVLDDLELANSHGDLTGALKAINDKLLAAFDKLGVVRIGTVGEAFNPELHEAVQDLSESDDKVIGTVLRPGFMIGERLVRTAMVIIADATANAEAPADE